MPSKTSQGAFINQNEKQIQDKMQEKAAIFAQTPLSLKINEYQRNKLINGLKAK